LIEKKEEVESCIQREPTYTLYNYYTIVQYTCMYWKFKVCWFISSFDWYTMVKQIKSNASKRDIV